MKFTKFLRTVFFTGRIWWLFLSNVGNVSYLTEIRSYDLTSPPQYNMAILYEPILMKNQIQV